METTLEDIDFAGLTSREFFPSPAAWEDEVLYFLMLDRFSDGQEDGYRDNDGNLVSSGSTPPFSDGDEGNAVASNVDADNWNKAGTRFVGGTLKGLQSKIGYLQRHESRRAPRIFVTLKLSINVYMLSHLLSRLRSARPVQGHL